MEQITTLYPWMEIAIQAVALIVVAALAFWLVATIIRKVLVGFKQAGHMEKKNGE